MLKQVIDPPEVAAAETPGTPAPAMQPDAEVLRASLPPADWDIVPHVCDRPRTQEELMARVACFYAGFRERSELPEHAVADIIWRAGITGDGLAAVQQEAPPA